MSIWNKIKKTKPNSMPPEEELRKHRCAFTGHRPEKLNRSVAEIKKALRRSIYQSVEDGYAVFITGMARGVDLWAAEIVLELRKKKNIKLICAIPYDGFELQWSKDWQATYRSVLGRADFVYVVGKNYSRDVFMRRNMWMVNHAKRLIAVYDGSPGGTRNTIDYAHRSNIEVIIV
jgi:uncharacterized phage-like protein YoqJ